MDDRLRRLRDDLHEIGCDQAEIADAERLIQAGDDEALIKHLRKCRCSLLEEMHACGRRIDRMDQLIRRSEQIAK